MSRMQMQAQLSLSQANVDQNKFLEIHMREWGTYKIKSANFMMEGNQDGLEDKRKDLWIRHESCLPVTEGLSDRTVLQIRIL